MPEDALRVQSGCNLHLKAKGWEPVPALGYTRLLYAPAPRCYAFADFAFLMPSLMAATWARCGRDWKHCPVANALSASIRCDARKSAWDGTCAGRRRR